MKCFVRSNKYLKTEEHRQGYRRVVLLKNGESRNVLVHRIVAEAFVENPENKPRVNHIDGNKANNTADNLEWCTSKENTMHSMYVLGNCIRAVRCIETGKVYNSISEAEREIDLKHPHIGDVCRGKQKTAGGFHWEYAEINTRRTEE